ncbi:MAG: DedA family protein [Candidatus Pacebacteria bacterium]|nr:DedA family protein [Candidatus Paceibacterota bacterium]
MTHLFDITYLLTTYGYLGIFIIIFLESGLFFALPGDSLLFTAGLLVAVLGLKLPVLIFVIFLATFLGGVMGYEIGIYLDKLRKFSFFRLILKDEYIEKTHKFFEKYGRLTIIFSRFVPIIRTFTPIVAGIAEVPYKFFIKYSLISSIAWATIITLLGYFLGRMFPIIKDYLWVVAILVVLVSLVPILIQVLKERKN